MKVLKAILDLEQFLSADISVGGFGLRYVQFRHLMVMSLHVLSS